MHHHKNIFQRNFIFIFIVSLAIYSCKNKKTEGSSFKESSVIKAPKNMVWIENKTFLQVAKEGDKYAMHREIPAHEVTVDGSISRHLKVGGRYYYSGLNITCSCSTRLLQKERGKLCVCKHAFACLITVLDSQFAEQHSADMKTSRIVEKHCKSQAVVKLETMLRERSSSEQNSLSVSKGDLIAKLYVSS